jgi:hypothetical protein
VVPSDGTAPAPADSGGTRDELLAHLNQVSGGGLKLLGEGWTSLGGAAQQTKQELQDHLTSLLAPPAPAASNAPTPSDTLTNPLGSGNAATDATPVRVGQGQSAFINSLQPLAARVAARTGIDPNVMIAIAANETGWGQSQTAKEQNNLFSIQGPSGGASRWASYDSPEQSFQSFVDLISSAPRYKQAWADRGDPAKFVDDLRNAGYVVDEPGYPAQGWVDQVKAINSHLPAAPSAGSNVVDRAAGLVQQGAQAVQQKVSDISQFGDSQLTAAEANAACGPAAAVRFAQRFGRNPTLREATDLAKTVGWTSGSGMAGLGSEKALMDKMGVATKLVSGPDWGTFANEARTGNPVTISTQGHYFTADGWDPATNRFHVGRSGMDLRGGSEWMTPEQMTGLMGPVQGGLLADNPTTPPSTTVTTVTKAGFTAPGGTTDQQAAAVEAPKPLQLIGEGFSSLGSGAQAAAQGGLKIIDNAIDTATQAAGKVVADTSGPQTAAMQPTPSDTLTNPLVTRGTPEPGSAQLTGQPAGGIAEPTGPAVLPSIGEAKDALLQGDTQGALDALNRAGTAISTSAPAQAIAENQANPPLAGAREAIANAPVLGGALGMARGPDLLSQDELLRTPEADTARAILEQMNRGAPVADADVAEATRTLLTSQAVAMTGEGFGRPGETGRPPSRPGAEEPAPGGTQILGPRGEVLSTVPAAPDATGLGAPSETARRVASTGPDAAEVARLRLDKFPEWLQPTIEDAARATDFAAEQRRGVIPNAQAEAMADQVGRKVEDWIAQSQPGKIFNTEETRALRNTVTAQAQLVNDLAKQVSDAAANGIVDDRLVARSVGEGDKLQALISVMEGNRAEWGRAGQAWQAATRLVDLPPGEAITQIYKSLGGRDNALEAVQHYNELVQSGAGPLQMANFWAGIKNPPAGVGDWLKALRYNSMLSGPRTVEVNAIGNALEIPWRLARDTGASFARGRPEELAPELSGLVAGLGKGNRAFMDTWTHGLTQEQLAAGELPNTLASRVRNPVGKAVAGAIDIPSRMLAAGDAWGSALAQSMALGRRAGVMASKEGLGGAAWKERVAELMANPSRDMLKEANAIAERMVYHGDMGRLGNALSEVQRVPVLGNAVLPFLRTVYHIAARGVDRTPVGAVGTAIDVARGKYGPLTRSNLREQLARSTVQEGADKGLVPLGERFGDNLMGSALTYAFYTKAQDGLITGAGPDDPEKRDMLKAQGWQPYSVKIGDHYVSYSNWGPIAESLSAVAGVAEAQQYAKTGASPVEVLVDEGKRTAKLVTEQSYLQGVGTLWKAFDDPQRYGGQSLGQFITSLVPYGSALNTLGQATDTVMRQPTKAKEGLGQYLSESVQARLPGLRQNVPVAQDQLGRPIPNEQSGAGALNPLRTTEVRSNVVLAELLRYGADVGEPPTSVRNVDLTPAEQRTVNEKAGGYIERNVQAVMADKDYQNADELGKQRALSRAVERGRMQAGGELLQSLSETEIRRRLDEGRAKRVPVPIGMGG